MKFVQLILEEIIKNVATRCRILSQKCRECRMLSHELFAKLHDASMISADLLEDLHWLPVRVCMTESTTRSVIKPSNCNSLRILLVYSHHTDSCVFWCHLRQTSPLTNIASRWFSCCAPTVWHSLPSFVCTAGSFTSFTSQLKTYMFARHLWPANSLSVPLIHLYRFLRVINSLLTTYLLTYPRSRWGSLQCSPDALAGLEGAYF